MIRLVKVRLVDEEGKPLKDVFVHLDIAGEEQVAYQHFETDEDGHVVQDERTAQFLEGTYHLIVTWIPEEDRLMLGYPSQEVKIEKGKDIEVPNDKVFSAPSPEYVKNKEELKKLKEIYKEKEGELLQHLKVKEEAIDSELATLQDERTELEEYESKLREEYEKVWDDEEDVKAQKIRIEMERHQLDEREKELQEAITSIADARERILAARNDVSQSVGMLEEERRKIFELSDKVERLNRDKENYLSELKQRIDAAEALSREAQEEKEEVAEARKHLLEGKERVVQSRKELDMQGKRLFDFVSRTQTKIRDQVEEEVLETRKHLEKGKERLEESRKALDAQGKRVFDLISHTQTGIRDQVEELEGKLKRRRSALLSAREVLLEGQLRINEDRQLLYKGQERIKELTEEGKNIILHHMENYHALVEEEKGKIKTIKSKLSKGRKKLREEYYLLLSDIQDKYHALEESKLVVKELDLKLRDGDVEVGKTIAEMEAALVKGDNSIYLNLLSRLKQKEKDIAKERAGIGREQKLAEKVRKDLETQLERLEDARAVREEYEARLDDLKEDERDLSRRERELERGIRNLEKEKERFEREKQDRMDAFAKSDAEIEEGYEELSRRRDDLRKEEDILRKERILFLKESMYYSCPKCEGIIKVKTEKRPLRVWCSSCGTEFNLKKARSYPCLNCGAKIEVRSEARPIDIKCPVCGSEYRLKKKAMPHENHVHVHP